MKNSRRRFLEVASFSVFGIGLLPIFEAVASAQHDNNSELFNHVAKETKKVKSAQRWGMIVDTRKIKTYLDIKPMIDACNLSHNIPTELSNPSHIIKWIWHEKFNHAFPDSINNFLNKELESKCFPVLCNHCEKPPCVRACPTKATFKRPDGIVLMDFHRCIGCRFCMAACPFGARSFNFRDPRPFIIKENNEFPTRMKGVVEKCNFCAERLAVGKIPSCVEVSNGILIFGDLKDPYSEVRKLLRDNYTIRRKQSLGTGPSIYYIV